jgi:hypothetical protein
MANPITTSGLNSGSVSTQHQSAQTTGEWVRSHCESLDSETPAGNTLTTEWTSAGGKEQTVTTRKAGESDATFMARHEAEFATDMTDAPPIP